MQDAIGITMGAVKDVSAKVDRLSEVIGIGLKPLNGGSGVGRTVVRTETMMTALCSTSQHAWAGRRPHDVVGI